MGCLLGRLDRMRWGKKVWRLDDLRGLFDRAEKMSCWIFNVEQFFFCLLFSFQLIFTSCFAISCLFLLSLSFFLLFFANPSAYSACVFPPLRALFLGLSNNPHITDLHLDISSCEVRSTGWHSLISSIDQHRWPCSSRLATFLSRSLNSWGQQALASSRSSSPEFPALGLWTSQTMVRDPPVIT